MKNTISRTILVLVGSSIMNAAVAQEWTGHLSGYLGNKTIKENNWANNNEHGSMGVITDFKQKDWPVSIAVDLFATGNEDKVKGQNSKTYSAQAHVGIRKVFNFDDCMIHPYVGGGVTLNSFFQKDKDAQGKEEYDDNDTAGWVGTGAYVHLTDSFAMGLDLRYSQAKVKLNNRKVDASGVMGGISVGYHW